MNISREKMAGTLRKVFPFQHLNGDHLQALISSAELVYFPEEKMIFMEGASSEAFYIVYEGQVDILQEKHRSLVYKNTIKPLFSFGEDVFIGRQIRRTSARAVSDTVLIKIPQETIYLFISESTAFQQGIQRQCASYEVLISKDLERIPDETISYVSQLHPLSLIFKMVAILIAVLGIGIVSIVLYNNSVFSSLVFNWVAAILALSGLGCMGWMIFEWSNDYFFFTDKRINSTRRTNLMIEERQETPLSAIESIQIRRNILGRSLGYGNIEVKTYTGSTRIPNVPYVIVVQQILHFLASSQREFADREEFEAFQEEIRVRINKPVDKSIPASDIEIFDEQGSAPKSDVIIEDDPDVSAGNIVYRTHWTILFSKIFIPALLLLSHIFLVLFLKANKFPLAGNSIFNWIIAVNCFLLFCWTAYRFADWRNDTFIITDRLLIDVDKRPFGIEEKRSAAIKNIQSIRYKKSSIFGLLLNFGTVYIRIGDDEFTFNNIHRPADVQEIIFAAKEEIHANEEIERKEHDRKRAVDWIDSYHQLIKQEKDKELNGEQEQEGE